MAAPTMAVHRLLPRLAGLAGLTGLLLADSAAGYGSASTRPVDYPFAEAPDGEPGLGTEPTLRAVERLWRRNLIFLNEIMFFETSFRARAVLSMKIMVSLSRAIFVNDNNDLL